MFSLDFLDYDFIQRAYLAGSFIAAACAMLGLFLVLRKFSLFGDGLAHVSFGAVALGLLLGIYPLFVALPVVLLASILILRLSETNKIYGDAAIGLVSSFGIAGGIILASMSNGFNIDLFSYLFGNILAVSPLEVVLTIGLSLVVLVTIIYFYHDLFSATFDESYARISGIKVEKVNQLLVLLAAITVVLAIKVVGVMLVSALLILPAVTALQIARKFKTALVRAGGISILSVWLGISLSFLVDLPAGAAIVMINFLFFVLVFSYKKFLQ